MIFAIRFRIGKRLGAASRYTLREFCTCVVDRYSLSEVETECVVTLKVGDTSVNEILEAKRVK